MTGLVRKKKMSDIVRAGGLPARPRFDPGPVQRHVLPNGLCLIVRECHSHPLVSVEAVVRAGAHLDEEQTAGLAALSGRLLDSGAGGSTAEEISREVESLGGMMMTHGGYLLSGISLSMSSDDLETALELPARMLIEPDNDAGEFEKRRQRVLADIVADKDNPRSVALKRFHELAFAGHPRHRPVEGYEETLRALTPEHVRRFYAEHYSPAVTCLAVSGDVDSSAVLARVTSLFGSWERGGAVNPPLPPDPASLAGRGLVAERIPMRKEQVNIYLGHPGIRRNDPDFFPLKVMDKILGQGFTSRLNSRLRDDLGLAYSTFGSITSSAGVDPGAFLCYIGTSPENEARAVEGIFTEIRRIREEPVPDEEVDAARRYLTGNYIFSLETNQEISGYLLDAELNGLPLDHIQHYVENIERVDASRIIEAAAAHLDPDNLVLVAAGANRGPGFTPSV
jgi:zinc protease